MKVLRRHTAFALFVLLSILLLASCSQESAAPEPDSLTVTPIPTAVLAASATTAPTATPIPEETATAAPEMSPTPSADSPTETATPAEEAPPATEPAEAQPAAMADCPRATAGLQSLYDPNHGYCLLYPDQYKVEKPNADETVLAIGGLLNTVDPRVSINVQPTDGRSANEIADQIVADLGSGWDIERSEITLADETAVRLDGLPGQDTYRQLIVIQDDQQFMLTFSPLDTDVSAGLEALYTQVVDTFTFVPPAVGEFEDCLQPAEGTQRLRQESQGFCLLLPTEYQSEQPNDNETVIYVESLLNTGRPRLFIQVSDAADKTAGDVANELLADLGSGFDIERTIGLTLGYEIAEQLDNVPGQDISRILFVVHDGRLYKLTLVPASEDAGEVYEEMLSLHDLVIRSFRFLP